MSHRHLPRVLHVASVIANGDRLTRTAYGSKTVDGLAELIERETGMVQLLAAARIALSHIEGLPADHAMNDRLLAGLRSAVRYPHDLLENAG